jgi:hypothetical protein
MLTMSVLDAAQIAEIVMMLKAGFPCGLIMMQQSGRLADGAGHFR